MSRTLTLVVIWAIVALLIAYDVWPPFTPRSTLSERMLYLGHRHATTPFAMGILIGHFWWCQQVEADWLNRELRGLTSSYLCGCPLLTFPMWLALGLLALGFLFMVVA